MFLKTSLHLHFLHFLAKKSTSGSLLRNIVSRYQTFYPLTIVSGLGWTWTYHGYPLETLWKSNCKFCKQKLCFLHQSFKNEMTLKMKITRWWVEQKCFQLQHYENEGLGYMFQCQHGPTECMGNKVHACSIKHIKDDRKLTDYIHCMIEDNYDPKEVGQSVRSP